MSKRQIASRLRELSLERQQQLSPWGSSDEEMRYATTLDQEALNWRVESKDRFDEDEDTFVYVSSSARDVNQYPSPGHYIVPLVNEINNIIKASIVQASFPLSDTVVHEHNNTVRFSFAPHVTIYTTTIPPGNYTGESLAVEIMCRLHSVLFETDLLAGTYHIDEATGFVLDAANNMPNETQVRVVYDTNRSFFRFQVVDKNKNILSTEFALHIQPPPSVSSTTYRNSTDDVFELLGFNRVIAKSVGILDAFGNYYITNTVNTVMSSNNNADTRYSYAVFSSESADLRGNCAFVIDIQELNENDINWAVNQQFNKFSLNGCFGMIYIRDAAHVKDKMVEFSSSSYPIQKFYRLGRSRVNYLTVSIKRLDGTIIDFDNKDHCFTIKLVSKKSQPEKAMFAR